MDFILFILFPFDEMRLSHLLMVCFGSHSLFIITRSSHTAIKAFTKLPRVHIPQTLSIGSYLDLDIKTSHYLCTVLRAKPNSLIRLFNSADGEFVCSITSVSTGKNAAKVEVVEQLRSIASEVSRPRVPLYFAPIKSARLKDMLESCTELGVLSFVPVITQNTDCKYSDFDTFERRLVEATEQSEQLFIPKISKELKLKSLLAEWQKIWTNMDKESSKEDQRPVLYICRERLEGSLSAHKVVKKNTQSINQHLLPGGLVGSCGVLIGPEGGFTAEELLSFEQCAFVRFLSLGSSVLRAETAAIAAVSIISDCICDDSHVSKNI